MSLAYDVSIVIVNYNGKRYIDTLFDGLLHLQHSDFTYEIVFVDNASSDDSVAYIKERYGNILDNLTIVESKKNLGFAGGNNLGVANAHGQYIALLNNDTRPEGDWLENLYHFIVGHSDVVIANSKLVFFYDFIRIRFYTQDKLIIKRTIRINDNDYQIDSKFCKNALCEPEEIVCFGHTEICLPLQAGDAGHTFAFMPVKCADTDRLLFGDEQLPMAEQEPLVFSLSVSDVVAARLTLIQNAGSGINENLDGYDIGFCEEDGEQFEREYEIENGCGAAIIFLKSDFDACGGFDERFFMYYEDADLSFRMKKDGRKIMYCPTSVVRHIHAGSSGEWSPFFTYHVCKNKLLFVRNNFGRRRFLEFFCRQLKSGLKEKNRSKLKGTIAALWLVLIGMLSPGPKAKKPSGNGSGSERTERAYRLWLKETREYKELYEELKSIEGDGGAIEDRFYRSLEFGTGGLRGVLGAGTNRMNVFTVAKATQGYSDYLNAQFECPSVAIAYDSRINSDLFARTAAEVFAANGIMVHIFPRLMPTPALSFAVRDLGCNGGIVITASHNPAEYNGYKVYGPDGCQITTEAAKVIQAAIDRVDPFVDVKRLSFEEAQRGDKIRFIGEETEERFQEAESSASVLPGGVARDISIVYTPLNGTGISCVPECLKRNGFTSITLVEEQKDPDGNFPTCPYPNPEIRDALQAGLQWAERVNSDLLLATDPDCDRVGTAVKNSEGGYTLITGNEMGVLLFDFICLMRQRSGTMPERPLAVKTIVTTPMAKRVAEHYGVHLVDVLTGFKYIGEKIGELEQSSEENRYIFGFEESYGYLSGSFVRDKDAVNASLLICEMFAYYQAQGRSLLDVLDALYRRYGFFESRLLSFSFKGSAGFNAMQELMTGMREKPPQQIAGLDVVLVKDYLSGIEGLPASNVLRWFLQDGCEVVVRPSGTEPKLKVYLTSSSTTGNEAVMRANQIAQYMTELING